MASLRRVRRSFRKAMLQLIEAGEGTYDNMVKLADEFYGSNDCGYKSVLTAFHQGEINNATSQLRTDGRIETIGKRWKAVEKLESSDVDVIIQRRVKRQRGEAKALVTFAHNHGRIEVATSASNVAHIFDRSEEEAVSEQPAFVG